MDYHGKRLLILGGAVQCLKVVEAAREMGVHSIVTDLSGTGAAKLAADEALPFSVMDTDAIVNWCREHPVDGVLNFNIDYAQITHQKVCELLNFPSYGTAEQYRRLTDKAAFKEMCIQNGVDVIPEYDERDLSNVQFPVLVKPTESSGSRGSTVCRTPGELQQAIAAAKAESKNHKALIEKYLYGCPDFSMSYIIIAGEPYLTRTLDRFVGRPEDNLQRQCICARCPSIYTELYLREAHGKVVAMLKGLGLKNAAVFMQGFIDGEKFRFYDPGIRFSGAEYERMLKSATGVDVVKAFVAYALGGDLAPLAGQLRDEVFRLKGACGLQLFIDAYPGTIRSVSGMDEVAAMPEVVSILQKHELGYEVPASGDVRQRLFEIVTLSENKRDSVEKVLDHIARNLSVKGDKDEELLTPLIGIDRLFA
ncbi:MAG: hypothetical protein IJK63_12110 [Oscillospiraceae bacterium]|nr:hypothetical protein [Clostridia bacterium]MBQ6274953.1 hypothetical protein [Oscillospiraceae bacterium]